MQLDKKFHNFDIPNCCSVHLTLKRSMTMNVMKVNKKFCKRFFSPFPSFNDENQGLDFTINEPTHNRQ